MSARTQPLLRYLRRLTQPSTRDAADPVLLERFVAQNDETAFAALLARHGPMVLGLCRRILRDGHDAEDAFQATFLVLARKAGTLRRPEALASWLYGTARHLAFTVRRTEARRRQRETDCLSSPTPATQGDVLDDLSARDLLLALDEELARLPDAYRLPLILCHLEGRTHEEAAQLLGWSAGSVKGRLERGRARLRARLVRRGLTLSASLLALESMGTASISAALREATVQKALAFSAGLTADIATNVLSLAEAGTAGIPMIKAKAVLVLLLMSLAAGTGALIYPVQTENPAAAKTEEKPQTAKPESTKQARKDRYGDPLPPRAVARLGSIRLRHSGTVWAVAFTPDGKQVLSGGSDNWAFLWDVATGKRLRAFRQSSIKSLAIDPQGKTLALASTSEGNVKRYELATGKELPAISGHLKGTSIVVFSLDGKLLATGGGDKKIRLWNTATARGIDTWQADRVYLPSLRFTPDGKSLAYVNDEGALHFRDVATGSERKPPGPLADARIYSFCFADEGNKLITASATDAGLLQLWDMAGGKEIRTVARTQGRTGHILLAPDGKSIWTADYDGRIVRLRQWDLTYGKQLLLVPYSPSRLDALALSPDGKHLAAGDFDGDIHLRDTKTGRRTLDFGGHHGSANAVVFAPDGQRVWTGGSDHTIRLWSAASGEQLRQFSTERDRDKAYDLALRPDGKILAAAVMRKTNSPFAEKCDVRLWDLSTNTEREPLRGHGGWVWGVAFSHDGRMLASRSWDQTLRLWDVTTGKERHVLRCQWQAPWGVAFTPDDSRVVSFLDKETVGFWDVDSGRLIRRLHVGPSVGEGIPLLSRDGRMLIAGGKDRPLRVWEVASGKERRRFDGIKPTGYNVVGLSPDSRILAVWTEYGQPIQLWDLRSGDLLSKFDGGVAFSYPSRMAFSLDSRFLASALHDGTTVIWDMTRLAPATRTTVKHSAPRLKELWNELAGEDAARAYRAVVALADAPALSVPLLRERLAEAASIKADPDRLARWLAELDSSEFNIREKASRGLQDLGILAEPALRRALRDKPSLEVRRRLEQILDKQESGARPAEQLRILRAFEVLELIGTAEAQRVLRERSQGSADSWLTHEAKAILARLAARP